MTATILNYKENNPVIPRVSNLTSPRTGEPVANQYCIETPERQVFQSYQTIIAIREWTTGKIILDQGSWDYSVTTGKYRNQFLGENKAETLKKIESGEYSLADLN